MEEMGYGSYMGGYDELERKREIYTAALDLMRQAITPEWYEEAARMFESIVPFEDAESLARTCREKAGLYYGQREMERKDGVYVTAVNYMNMASYEISAEMFSSISGWRDADERRAYCYQKIDELKRRRVEEQRRKNRGILIAIVASAMVLLTFFSVVAVEESFGSWNLHRLAMDAYESGDYEEAHEKFWELTYEWGFEECEEMVRESAYYWAIELYVDGRYQEAYSKLSEINDTVPYRDSEEVARDILQKYPTVARVGDIITFGRYEQDNDLQNGKEEIEWLVYWKSGTVIYAMSKNVLDCQPYDVYRSDVVWEDCSLNAWLNTSFYQEAFIEKEREMILKPADDTKSAVFLLTAYDVRTYLSLDGGGKCEATDYAQAMGVTMDGEDGCGWWIEDDEGSCQFVSYYIESDIDATADFVGVRPVIKITEQKSGG